LEENYSGTRYKAPTLRHIIPRTHLLSYLKKRKDRKVFLIVGGAGQGKSTLAADFLARNRLQYTWINLTDKEQDPKFLLECIGRGLAQNVSGKNALPAQDPLPAALLNLVREQTKGDHFIVFDNFQRVNSSREIGEQFEQFIAFLPDRLHLIILSREYPRFSLTKLRIERNLGELRGDDLAFTEEEIHTLMQSQCQINLDRVQMAGIAGVCEGWVTALVSLIELLDSRPETERNHLIETFVEQRKSAALDFFIEEEIFNPLSKMEKAVLTRLAGYTSIQALLATRLVGEDGLAVLKNLIERNILLKWVDESLTIFLFHPMFTTFLAEKFQALPANEQTELHRRAAFYFKDYGDRAEAIHHFILGGEYDKARDVFQEIAEDSLEQHKYDKIHELLTAFPEDFRNQSPILLYYYTIITNLIQPSLSRKTLRELISVFKDRGDINREARIYSVLLANYIFYQGNREAVEELLELAQSCVDHSGSSLDSDRKEVLVTLISLGSWWTKPELDDAFKIALRAEETSCRVRNQEVLILTNLVIARINIDRGEFQRAKEILNKTEKLLIRNPAYRQYDALLRFYLGDTYFYLGEIHQAIDQAKQGWLQIYPGFAFCKYLKLNQVLYTLYLPETKTAEPILEELDSEEIGENLYVRYYSIYLLHMRSAYRKGNRHRAEYYCNRLQEPENQKLLQTDYPYSIIALTEVLYFLGHTDETMRLLKKLIIDAPPDRYPYPCATALALLGLLHNELNQKEDSVGFFTRLGEILDQKGYRNLDICSVRLLERIAEVSELPQFREFTRLKKAETEFLAAPSETVLCIQTLGEFNIFVRGKVIPKSMLSRQKKVLDFLKLLVVHCQNGILKETLYDLFWPGYLHKSCRDNLNTIIYRLRKILGEEDNPIITEGNTVRLNGEVCTVDVGHFLEYIKQCEQAKQQDDHPLAMACYNKAEGLYGGDFLENDLYYDDIRDYRETLKNMYMQMLFNITIVNFDAGMYQEALVFAKKLVQKDPLCETAYRLLMIASILVGNRSAVSRVVEKLNKTLQNYYGIEADPKTIALKEKLLKGLIPEASLWQSEVLI